jgi:hypothetical protein
MTGGVEAIRADFRVAEYDVPAVTLRTVAPPDIDAFFDALTTRVRGEEIVVVDRPLTEEGADRDRSVWALVESVGDCSAIRLAEVAPGAGNPTALVVAASAVIRRMCATVEPLPPAEAVTSSDPLRWTYRAFERLWTHDVDPSDWWRLPPDVGGRKLPLYEGIGERMGELHRTGAVWSDAHRENFVLSTDGVWVVDLEDHARVLYRAPTAARSATDLVPLLSELWPPQWDWLRTGYRAGRGPDAEPVIDLIERREPVVAADRAHFLWSFPRRKLQAS